MGAILDSLTQIFTRDFWGRILTRPHEAVIQHPDIAAKSALAGAAATLAVAGGIVAAPVVASTAVGLFAAGKVVAAPVAFAARHPILSYVLATQSDLPTELVRAFGQIYGAPTAAPGAAPAPVQLGPPPGVTPLTRGPVPGPSNQLQAMFAW